MTLVPCRRVVLITFFIIILCFISITTAARSMRSAGSVEGHAEHINIGVENTSHHEYMFETKDGDSDLKGADLMTVDYTPAKKKPPIHN
ncbi:hypothetical protein F0562_024010 [Nyssa sinensis]|uniref:Uncharacterized protein n=1 Tax=Nyssa sinensis TaxID=561372 RepID=A0A5J5BJQ9_9ASTE|nr:hypothetical protein F0562_024010 [Nyssa sinensis]